MSSSNTIISFYEYDDYRILISKLVASKRNQKLSLTQIATDSGIQPSYLSSVVNKKSHLNQDQLFSLCSVLDLSENESDYLFLLLEWERSGFHKRKESLRKRIDELRDSELRIDKILKTRNKKTKAGPDSYYLDPYLMIMHLYLGSNRAKQDISGIAEDLRISSQKTRELVDTLASLGLIKKSGSDWEILEQDFHLPADSPLVKTNQAAFRALSIARISALTPNQHYSFGATINLNDGDLTKIRVEFLKFVQRCKEIVDNSDSSKVMQMQFDLFPWVD